jgi:hypothetical protein
MLDDVGTSCATTNATPDTSFAPRQGVNAPLDWTGNRLIRVCRRTHTIKYAMNAPVHSS